TLAVNALLYGTVLYLTKGTSTEAVPPMLSGFAVGRIYGIPYLAVFALTLIVLIEIGIRATVWGRRFVAVGVNARAARAASLRVTTYKVATYAIAGAFYALSGSARWLFARSELAGRKQLSLADNHGGGARRDVVAGRCRERRRHGDRRHLPGPAPAG